MHSWSIHLAESLPIHLVANTKKLENTQNDKKFCEQLCGTIAVRQITMCNTKGGRGRGHELRGKGQGQPKGHAVKRNRSTAANRATTLAKVKAKAKAEAEAKAKTLLKPKLVTRRSFSRG